jgi:hypothetical protein
MKTYGITFFISALYSSSQLHATASLLPDINWILEGLMSSRAGTDVVALKKIPADDGIPVVRLVASDYWFICA